jgi:enoyl reductase
VKGDTGDPPCGVTYLRSNETTGPYPLKATVTWKISWTGTGQAKPVALPDGTFGTPQNVTVQEIQAVNG